MVRKCGLPIFDEDTRGWILCTNEMAARDGRSVLFFQVAGGTHNTIGEEHAAFSYNELLYPGKPMPQFYVMQQGAHKRCCLTCNALFRKAFNAAMNLLAEDDKPRENTPGDMLAAYRAKLAESDAQAAAAAAMQGGAQAPAAGAAIGGASAAAAASAAASASGRSRPSKRQLQLLLLYLLQVLLLQSGPVTVTNKLQQHFLNVIIFEPI